MVYSLPSRAAARFKRQAKMLRYQCKVNDQFVKLLNK